MSSFDGKLHQKDANVVTAILTAIGLIVLVIGLILAPWVALVGGGILLGSRVGWWLSPDLDHTAMTRTEYQAMKKGPIGFLWVALWTPYAAIPHRSFLSHSIIGSIGRVAIFCAVFIHLPWWVLFKTLLMPGFGIGFWVPWGFYAGVAIAQIVHDSVHYVRDGLDPLGMMSLWK